MEPENRTAASKNTNEETHFRLPATAGIRIFSGMPPSLYVVFSCVAPGANQLSVDELHRRLEWREKTRTAFPNSGEYIVVAPADKALGVPDNLAEQRLQSLIGLLRNIGVPQSDVLYAEVHQRGSGKILPTDKAVMQQALRDINTATIEINPRCPHACCPGPRPIQP